MEIYGKLLEKYGPRGWWPLIDGDSGVPVYHAGPPGPEQRFEIALGAVLTQNTSWKNASKALAGLYSAGLSGPLKLSGAPKARIARIIRSSGYFNQKAERVKVLSRYFIENEEISRTSLLLLKGIGPETADSIMLYAFGKPHFVVDAYTRRIFTRAGILDGGEDYDTVQSLFESGLPEDVDIFKEYHALIVEHAKRFCRRTPLCGDCPIYHICERFLQ